MPDKITALLLGDVFGTPGVRALFTRLASLRKAHKADIVIVNGENAAEGLGITEEIAEQLFSLGVDVITSGNHIWHRREIVKLLDSDQPILRPANYPPGTPGKGSVVVTVKSTPVAVMNLQGREDMRSIDCPFRTGKEIARKLQAQTKVILTDFHAESVREKESLAFHLDGQVSALIGTHTHIQTADEKIMPQGCAYITDMGMCGPDDSVIGSSKEISVQRSLSQMPLKMEVSDTSAVIQGVKVVIDVKTGKATKIERISERSLV